MKLTRAERLVIARIVNIRLDSATLKDHILLEGIYRAIMPDEINLSTPLDFVENENDRELFTKYDGQPVNQIENEDDKKVITEAIQKARMAELEVWANDEKPAEIDLSGEQTRTLKNFFDKDNRPFPREQHAAIVSLHDKLEENLKEK